MKKEILELNKFNYLNDENIYSSDSLDILGFVVKPNGNSGNIEVVSLMKHKLQDKEDYYSYHHFNTTLKNIELDKKEILNELKNMYLNDDSLQTEGESTSGSKIQILDELINYFTLDREIINRML